jgi:hypothetical protein
VWETWPAIDAYYAAHLPWGTPMVLTDMQMLLQRVLPRSLHTTFGTPELVRQAQAAGHPHATLLLPPVDTRINAPGRTPDHGFRQQWSVSPTEITLVTVSRLEDSMKGESLTYSLQAVRSLGRELPLRLLVVGDGTARERLTQLAAEVNAELGREAVTLTGAMRDPRAAYAAADIVLGMGSSALGGGALGEKGLRGGVGASALDARSRRGGVLCPSARSRRARCLRRSASTRARGKERRKEYRSKARVIRRSQSKQPACSSCSVHSNSC